IGAESEFVETTLDYRSSILTPLTDDILKYLARKFEENIPPGFQRKNRQVVLTGVKTGEAAANRVEFKLSGRGVIKGVLDAGRLKNLIRGKAKGEATVLLTQQNEVAHFNIRIKSNAKR